MALVTPARDGAAQGSPARQGKRGAEQEVLHYFWASFESAETEREFVAYNHVAWLSTMRWFALITVVIGTASAIIFSEFKTNLYMGVLSAINGLIVFGLTSSPAFVKAKGARYCREIVLFGGGPAALWLAIITLEGILTDPSNDDKWAAVSTGRSYVTLVSATVASFSGFSHAQSLLVILISCLCFFFGMTFSTAFSFSAMEVVGQMIILLCICALFAAFSFENNRSSRLRFLMIRRLKSENITVGLMQRNSPVMGIFKKLLGDTGGSEAQGAMRKRRAPWEVDPESISWSSFLGRGAYGEVHRATWRGTLVAVKRILTTGPLDPETLADFAGEAALLSELRHPNVVLFMGVSLDVDNLLLVTEFMERGSLFDLIHEQHVPITPSLCFSITAQAAKGMNYLHCQDPPVLHKDLKTGNLLVDNKWNVKIADFGVSAFGAPDKEDAAEEKMGTLMYMPPEVMQEKPYTREADVYSFGVIMSEVATQTVPFSNSMEEASPFSLIGLVVYQQVRPQKPSDYPHEYTHLMESCWATAIGDRSSFQHCVDVLSRLEQVWNNNPDGSSSGLIKSPNTAEGTLTPVGRVTLVHTDVENSNAIWEAQPVAMRKAVEILNAIITDAARECAGHIVRSEVGRFFIVFAASRPAAKWVARVQEDLVKAEWPPEIATSPLCREMDDDDGNPVFRGLRLRIGISRGEPDVARDPLTGFTNYHGVPVIESAKLLGLSRGGEAVCSAELADELSRADAGDDGWIVDKTKIKDQQLFHILPKALAVARSNHWQSANRSTTMASVDSQEVLSGEAKDKDKDKGGWVVNMDDVELGAVVGMGSYGEVLEGHLGGKRVAVKRLLRKSMSEAARLQLYEESCLMRTLDHPNVVRLLGASLMSDNICLVFEFMTRSLRELLNSGEPYDARQVLLDLLNGLKFIHSRNVIHRDLKPSNLMLDENNTVKISDFGLARVKTEAVTMTKCGTVSHCAPEVLRGLRYTFSADVFSVGIIAWELMTRRVAYGGTNPMSVVMHVLAGDSLPTPKSCPKYYKQFMEVCWRQDPESRPSIDDLLGQVQKFPKINIR